MVHKAPMRFLLTFWWLQVVVVVLAMLQLAAVLAAVALVDTELRLARLVAALLLKVC